MVHRRGATQASGTRSLSAFLLIAAVASWVPALRAAALDPARALREE
jgi:ABC-type lipoprotein release transport system permease subunit